MAFDVEAAKQEGYTDEEIAAFLRSEQGTPVPVQEEPSRGAEMAATLGPAAASAVPGTAAAVGAGYGLAKYGPGLVQKAGEAIGQFRGSPTVGSPGNPIGGAGTRIPVTTGAPGPVTVPVSGPVSPQPVSTTSAGRPFSPQAQEFMAQRGTAPAQQPGIIQRATDTASRIRELAAQRVAGFSTGAAGVPAAVGAGGAVATGIAGGQMGAMTPEQRKAYYDNMMLGAMGGDAALGAAIMNRGQ